MQDLWIEANGTFCWRAACAATWSTAGSGSSLTAPAAALAAARRVRAPVLAAIGLEPLHHHANSMLIDSLLIVLARPIARVVQLRFLHRGACAPVAVQTLVTYLYENLPCEEFRSDTMPRHPAASHASQRASSEIADCTAILVDSSTMSLVNKHVIRGPWRLCVGAVCSVTNS